MLRRVLLLVCLLLSTQASQRFRVTVSRGNSGFGLRLVRLKSHVVILEITAGSPAESAGGGLLKVGDAIIAVGNTAVPTKSTVRDVERLILQQNSLTVDLIVLKNWQTTTTTSSTSGTTTSTSGTSTTTTKTKTTPSPPPPQRHTRAPPPKTWRYTITLTRTPTTGFGLQLRMKNNLIVIDGVAARSVAYDSHLLSPEDQIEAINNHYVYTQTLNQVIDTLRAELTVHLIVISATTGSVRETYLNVKLDVQQRGFLGMKMKYSNHNNSVYIDKIFRTGIVAKDGQLNQGDNIVAVSNLDVVHSIATNKRMVISKITKALQQKKQQNNGPVSSSSFVFSIQSTQFTQSTHNPLKL